MRVLDRVQAAVDTIFARWPQKRPDPERLKGVRLVSHRGEHDNRRVLENTLAAFDRVQAAGVWGVELDIRWTRDLQPVVFHDPDTGRVFGGKPRKIMEMTRAEVRSRFPAIPALAEVIARYGKRLHLMVEIKAEHYPDPARQNRILADLFSGLAPGSDYHVLSLAPAMLHRIDFLPPRFLLPIAGTNIRQLSRLALDHHWGGLCGHYLLMTRGLQRRHVRNCQRVGTGFVASGNCLFREVNRDVSWIFSNHAARLQAAADASVQATVSEPV